MKRLFLLAVLFAFASALTFALVGCNSGPKPTATVTFADGSTLTGTVQQIADAYRANPVVSKEKFNGAKAEVNGYITRIDEAGWWETMNIGPSILVGDKTSPSFPAFNVEFSDTSEVAAVKVGDFVKVTGTICTHDYFDNCVWLRLKEYKGQARVAGGPTTVELVQTAK